MKQQLSNDVPHVSDRDTELGADGKAAGTLTPSSRCSSLVSGQLLYHPASAPLSEEPVHEQVSRLYLFEGCPGAYSQCL
jgi:hypothetical protein